MSVECIQKQYVTVEVYQSLYMAAFVGYAGRKKIVEYIIKTKQSFLSYMWRFVDENGFTLVNTRTSLLQLQRKGNNQKTKHDTNLVFQ